MVRGSQRKQTPCPTCLQTHRCSSTAILACTPWQPASLSLVTPMPSYCSGLSQKPGWNTDTKLKAVSLQRTQLQFCPWALWKQALVARSCTDSTYSKSKPLSEQPWAALPAEPRVVSSCHTFCRALQIEIFSQSYDINRLQKMVAFCLWVTYPFDVCQQQQKYQVISLLDAWFYLLEEHWSKLYFRALDSSKTKCKQTQVFTSVFTAVKFLWAAQGWHCSVPGTSIWDPSVYQAMFVQEL